MQIEEAYKAAEEMLYGHYPRLGESGWRCWTDAERKKLHLMANSIYTASGGESFLVAHDGRVRPKP